MFKYNVVYFLFFVIGAVLTDDNFMLNSVIRINNTENNYFGYSLLLQTSLGKNRLLVGAPLDYKFIYECDPSEKPSCTKILALNDKELQQNRKLNATPFLGSVLDGEKNIGTFVTCAPRYIPPSDSIYTKGYCKEFTGSRNDGFTPVEDESDISSERVGQRNTNYYKAGFTQAGFSLQYIQKNEILLGLPGFDNFNGQMMIYDIDSLEIIGSKKDYTSVFAKPDEYLGYSVASGKLQNGERWYIAGKPRGNNLFGQVIIWNTKGSKFELKGSEYGSYFGASLLAEDVTKDGYDDLFVGAPTSSGSQFDEGRVSFFRYNGLQNKFEEVSHLSGEHKPGSRFGTCMAKLGDIDLDGYNDVAISAPFENKIGAVYIFKGSAGGPIRSQRITPESFNAIRVKGFGLGISNGNDIDHNGHNDVAIGAYKSGHVFILKSKLVIDLSIKLSANVKSITAQTTNFTAKYCLSYKTRSKATLINKINFAVNLMVDYRIERSNTPYKYNVELQAGNKEICKDIRLETILKSNTDLSPIKLSLKTDFSLPNVIVANNQDLKKLDIPLSHGCGDDNLCEPLLQISATSKINAIVLGQNNILEVDVVIKNTKDPALKCEVIIEKSSSVELRNAKICSQEDNEIVCPISNSFVGEKNLKVTFDIKNIQPTTSNLTIIFKVRTLASPLRQSKLQDTINLPVVLKNSPYIQGKSDPENFELKRDTNTISFVQKYLVGNSGPSPMIIDVHIFSPVIENVISVTKTQISTKDESTECTIRNSNSKSKIIGKNDIESTLKVPANKTIFLNCLGDDTSCTKIVCKKGYLSASDNAEITIAYEVDVKALESRYKTKLLTKEVISFTSSGVIHNYVGHASTLIYGHPSKSLPLWIYIVSAVVGLILLALLVFILYKCNFFNRMYRDRLKEEKLLGNEVAISTNPCETDSVRMSAIEENAEHQ